MNRRLFFRALVGVPVAAVPSKPSLTACTCDSPYCREMQSRSERDRLRSASLKAELEQYWRQPTVYDKNLTHDTIIRAGRP